MLDWMMMRGDWTNDSGVIPPVSDKGHWRDRHGGKHLESKFDVNEQDINTFPVKRFVIVLWIIFTFLA